MRAAFEQAIAALGGQQCPLPTTLIAVLFAPAFVRRRMSSARKKALKSSNKATEEVAEVAMDTRKRLAERVARARAMRRSASRRFKEAAGSMKPAPTSPTLPSMAGGAGRRRAVRYQRAPFPRGEGWGRAGITPAPSAGLLGLTRLAFLALGKEIFGEVAAAPEHLELLAAAYRDPLHRARCGYDGHSRHRRRAMKIRETSPAWPAR